VPDAKIAMLEKTKELVSDTGGRAAGSRVIGSRAALTADREGRALRPIPAIARRDQPLRRRGPVPLLSRSTHKHAGPAQPQICT